MDERDFADMERQDYHDELEEIRTHRASMEPAGNQESAENQVRRLTEANRRMAAAINWACGCGISDFSDYSADDTKKPRYWWREQLAKLAGLTWLPESACYILAEPKCTPTGSEDGPKGEAHSLHEALGTMYRALLHYTDYCNLVPSCAIRPHICGLNAGDEPRVERVAVEALANPAVYAVCAEFRDSPEHQPKCGSEDGREEKF